MQDAATQISVDGAGQAVALLGAGVHDAATQVSHSGAMQALRAMYGAQASLD